MKSHVAAVLLLLAALTASGNTFVVINTNDSGPGSLRQAIEEANSTPGTHVINFQIPGSGVHTINLASPLAVAHGCILDGYTQPGARPNSLAVGTDAVLLVELNGSAVPGAVALEFPVVDATVRGLVINGDVAITDGPNQLSGCYIGTNAAGSASSTVGGSVRLSGINNFGNIIGGTTPADRNVIAKAILIRGDAYPRPAGTTIQGNYLGVSADGRSFFNSGPSLHIFNSDNTVLGGTTPAARNVIGGGAILGNVHGTLVQNNWIGTDATGMAASADGGGFVLGHGTNPVSFGDSTDNTVLQNVIVSSHTVFSAVVTLNGRAIRANTFKGNLIGLGADGKTQLGNRLQGIACLGGNANTIGGVNPGDGNLIAFNPANQSGTEQQPAAGIRDTGYQTDNRTRNFFNGNSIVGNGGLGIDVAGAGATPNDEGDQDEIQNYPVLTVAVFTPDTVRVTGSLNSIANTSFRIEFFGNDTTDPSGHGRWQHYFGFANVTTGADGNAPFDVTLPVPASVTSISSTATGPTGTSEFSAALSAKLLNISTRAEVGTGDDVVIAGFIISGPDAKTVMLRGIGPSMSANGAPMPGRLQDPVIALYDSSGAQIAVNNDWQSAHAAEIAATGLAPTDDLESALLVTLPPATYTVKLLGLGGTGIGLVEIYDLAQQSSVLANISTRSRVETGDSVMIGGFIISGNNGRGARVLIRGLGPSIPGVPNPLPDPTLELRDENGALLATNDDWKTNEAQVAATGIPPTDERESALVADLVSGNYTVILRGKNNSAGTGLIEVYHL